MSDRTQRRIAWHPTFYVGTPKQPYGSFDAPTSRRQTHAVTIPDRPFTAAERASIRMHLGFIPWLDPDFYLAGG